MSDVLNLLGLARRAGKLQIGHDAALLSVRKGNATLVILTADASARHKRELEAAGFSKVVSVPFTMADTGVATGKKSCIYALEDEGFSNAFINKLSKEGI